MYVEKTRPSSRWTATGVRSTHHCPRWSRVHSAHARHTRFMNSGQSSIAKDVKHCAILIDFLASRAAATMAFLNGFRPCSVVNCTIIGLRIYDCPKKRERTPNSRCPLSDLPVHLAALAGQRGELLTASTERRCKDTNFFRSLQMFFSANSRNAYWQRKRGTNFFSCLLLHVTDVTLSTNYTRRKSG